MGTLRDRLAVAILMSTLNICLNGEILKRILGPRPLGPGEIDGLLVPPGKACFTVD